MERVKGEILVIEEKYRKRIEQRWSPNLSQEIKGFRRP